MMQGQSGRTNKSGSQQTGVNQTAALRISDIRSNYNYPSWFDTTMGYFRDGRISSQAFESAYANLAKQGLITLKTGGTPATPSGSFESLFPTQTSQLIKIGQDTEPNRIQIIQVQLIKLKINFLLIYRWIDKLSQKQVNKYLGK